MATQGAFIVLEGPDSQTTATQYQLLFDQLRQAGHQVVGFEFPRQQQASGYFVKKYLDNTYGEPSHIGPYTGSLFYALDHFDAAVDIRQALNSDKVVIAHHFSASNMAGQGVKFHAAAERRGFYVWLDNLEFEVLNLPRPDINLILRDNSLRDDVTAIYDDLCQLFPKDFHAIDTQRNGKQLDARAVHRILLEKVRPMLPQLRPGLATIAADLGDPQDGSLIRHHKPFAERQTAVTASQPNVSVSQERVYFTPSTLDKITAAAYHQFMAESLAATRQLRSALQAAGLSQQQVAELTSLTLPVAATDGYERLGVSSARPSDIQDILASHVRSDHTAGTMQPLQLAGVVPRNEFELLGSILYAQSDLTLQELRALSDSWPYERKAQVLTTYYRQDLDAMPSLDSMRYDWDIVSSYSVMQTILSQTDMVTAITQVISPRLGYEVPAVLDQPELSDAFEERFDESLRFYSLMQQNGYAREAQLTALSGHRLRWQLSLNARQLKRLMAINYEAGDSSDSVVSGLISSMRAQLQETHPLLAETFKPE